MPGKAVTVRPGPLHGSVALPGDKSISHRALIAAAHIAESVRIEHLNSGRDVQATREALTAMGAHAAAAADAVVMTGGRLVKPAATLDCMNSGSTVRMLLGACAGANVPARFDGDASLRHRPMEPVAAQLRAFGARIATTDGRLPLELLGTPEIQTRHFILLAPSAQVKSALLFAGLFGRVPVRVDGDRGSRDHTERLLRYLGADIEWSAESVSLRTAPLESRPIAIAGDFSAAAFFITAAAIVPGSAIVIRQAGVNPTRTGLLDALRAMGAGIELQNERTACGEPLADIRVEWRPLQPASVEPSLALRAIDEIPLLAVAAAFAPGTTTIRGVADLRTKESDRLAAIERLLSAVGIHTRYERGVLSIDGGVPRPSPGDFDPLDDHRIAMTAAVLACAAGPLSIASDASLDVSFPGFLPILEACRA
ncbi:MAG: 3-phosphoshikimate 1-carboxyvinyltransferase [Candidatus Eremiobacteraeota bacterium]|nr:3-phosphoshikimate 1-carboxyvinyltransferase [Candidatus Eremiobacteraeota bacterium]